MKYTIQNTNTLSAEKFFTIEMDADEALKRMSAAVRQAVGEFCADPDRNKANMVLRVLYAEGDFIITREPASGRTAIEEAFRALAFLADSDVLEARINEFAATLLTRDQYRIRGEKA